MPSVTLENAHVLGVPYKAPSPKSGIQTYCIYIQLWNYCTSIQLSLRFRPRIADTCLTQSNVLASHKPAQATVQKPIARYAVQPASNTAHHSASQSHLHNNTSPIQPNINPIWYNMLYRESTLMALHSTALYGNRVSLPLYSSGEYRLFI